MICAYRDPSLLAAAGDKAMKRTSSACVSIPQNCSTYNNVMTQWVDCRYVASCSLGELKLPPFLKINPYPIHGDACLCYNQCNVTNCRSSSLSRSTDAKSFLLSCHSSWVNPFHQVLQQHPLAVQSLNSSSSRSRSCLSLTFWGTVFYTNNCCDLCSNGTNLSWNRISSALWGTLNPMGMLRHKEAE